MMGATCSKNSSGNAPSSSSPPPPPPPPPPPAPQSTPRSQFTVDLSEYDAVVKADPALRSFNTNLQERTSLVMGTIASGVDCNSLSFDSLREVTNCLLDMNQEAVKFILKSKEDVWKNKELLALVEQYFDNSSKTLEFCTSLDGCLRRAQNSQLFIQIAVRQFEEETESQDGLVEKKYLKTLEHLKRFKMAEDPFPKEFFVLFHSVYQEQHAMLTKLLEQKKKLDKKMRSMKTWRRVSNVVFVTAFASVLILSVVAAAVAAPPFVTALASALAVPIGSVGKWLDVIWNRCEKTLKGQLELTSSVHLRTVITIAEMGSVQGLVDKFEVKAQSLLDTADLALQDADALNIVIDEIKKNLDEFSRTIEELSKHADRCRREISQARTVILLRIMKDPDS